MSCFSETLSLIMNFFYISWIYGKFIQFILLNKVSVHICKSLVFNSSMEGGQLTIFHLYCEFLLNLSSATVTVFFFYTLDTLLQYYLSETCLSRWQSMAWQRQLTALLSLSTLIALLLLAWTTSTLKCLTFEVGYLFITCLILDWPHTHNDTYRGAFQPSFSVVV